MNCFLDFKKEPADELSSQHNPLAIEARHRGKTYTGTLLDEKGKVRWNDEEYVTPSTAAKVIATDWKQVIGWMFWKYEDSDSGKLEYISKLRGELGN